jgi:HD-GYP domain-containing protein (c-di-GMP phosphodiesterase class II)
MPGDRESAPLAAAGAMAYALLPAWDGSPVSYGVPQVVVAVTVGTLIGSLPHFVAGRAVRLEDASRRIIVVAAVAALFRPLLDSLDTDTTQTLALVMTVVALLGGVIDTALAAVVRAAVDRSPFRRTFIDEVRAAVGIGSAITATGILIALAAGSMGWLALVVFSIPLLLTQFSFRRYAAIRATYLQTIRSLSRVTDVGGYTDTGHAQRVASLSKAVGRDLGLSEADLLELDYAALMHDIGQLSLQDPIPGGATSLVTPEMQQQIADLGAEVIKQASVMGDVAVMVGRQADPYRPEPGVVDETLPIESRIIRACNDYDDLVGARDQSDRRAKALERLRSGCAREYDPQVVDSLSRVVSHQRAMAG